MENKVSTNQEQWTCPKCQVTNQASEEFCKNCGHQKGTSGSITIDQPKKSKTKKIIIWVVSILLLVAVAAGGGYAYYVYNLKKQAKSYLSNESSAFANSISIVNDLATEELVDVEDRDENFDLYLKKLEEERNKAEKALAEIREIRQKNEQATSNKKVSSIDSLLKDYYETIEEDVDRYTQFYVYDYATSEASKELDDAFEKMGNVFRGTGGPEELVNQLKEALKLIEDAKAKTEAVAVPSGMEEYHEKGIKMYDDLIYIHKELIDAIEKEDLMKLQSLMFGDRLNQIEKGVDESRKLYEFHFDEIHKEFEESRKSAENVKNELIKAGVEMDVTIQSANIEAW